MKKKNVSFKRKKSREKNRNNYAPIQMNDFSSCLKFHKNMKFINQINYFKYNLFGNFKMFRLCVRCAVCISKIQRPIVKVNSMEKCNIGVGPGGHMSLCMGQGLFITQEQIRRSVHKKRMIDSNEIQAVQSRTYDLFSRIFPLDE